MTDIGRINQILIQIRGAIAAKSERSTAGRGTTSARGAKSPAGPTARASVEQIQSALSHSLDGIDLSSGEGKARARRVLVESILLGELGVEMANDPNFLVLVDRVEAALSEHAGIRAEFDAFLTSTKE